MQVRPGSRVPGAHMRPDAPLAVVAAVAVLAVVAPAQQPAPVAPDLTNPAAFTARALETHIKSAEIAE